MFPASFDYHAPTTLRQARALLARYGEEAKLLAGGQSLVPLLRFRLATPAHLIDLGRIEELREVREGRGALLIGAMATHWMIESSDLIRERLPVLAECARAIADMQVRNRGTIGGSLAHADPAADYPAVLLALDAEVKAVGPDGTRTISLEEFFAGPLTTVLEPTEILTEVRIPLPPPRTGAAYEKFANPASHFAIVGVAARLTLTARGAVKEARLGITGATPTPVRARAAEEVLTGRPPSERNLRRAAARAAEGLECNSDIHASADYRAHLCGVLALRALQRAAARAQGGR